MNGAERFLKNPIRTSAEGSSEKKTIQEWEQEYGIYIMDIDGFDSQDPKLYERLFTRQEFEQSAAQCTVIPRKRQTPDSTPSASTTAVRDNPARSRSAGSPPAAATVAAAAISSAAAAAAGAERTFQDESQAWSKEGIKDRTKNGIKDGIDKRIQNANKGEQDSEYTDPWQAGLKNGLKKRVADLRVLLNKYQEKGRDQVKRRHRTKRQPSVAKASAPEKQARTKGGYTPFHAVNLKTLNPVQKRLFLTALVLVTLPTLGTWGVYGLYGRLTRRISVKWVWPAGMLALDFLILLIQPVTPFLSGAGYLWYLVLGLLAQLIHSLWNGLNHLFSPQANAVSGGGPFLSSVTVAGNPLNLYFTLDKAVVSSLILATAIVSVHDLIRRGLGKMRIPAKNEKGRR